MANPGTWQSLNLDGMPYYLLLPDGYTTDQQYPVLLFLHGGGHETRMPDMTNSWFNTAEFRASYPAIVIEPVISGSSLYNNWGGYAVGDYRNQDMALAILSQTMAQYSADPNRVYVTGLSLGGFGSWDLMIRYNAYNGVVGRIFAAGSPFAGADAVAPYAQPMNVWSGGPTSATIEQLRNVPIWAVHGSDGTQHWDQAMAAALGTDGAYRYTENLGLGHNVWDNYYPLPTARALYDWIFGQAANLAPGGGRTIIGDAGDNVLISGAGDDGLRGGNGDDLVKYSQNIEGYRIGISGDHIRIDGPDGYDDLTEVERLQFGASAPITVESLRNRPGIDELMSFMTEGRLSFELPIEYSGALDLRYVYPGTSGSDIVAGTSFNDFMNLGGGDDAVHMGSGDDIVDGGGGSNFLSGDAGRDAFFLDGRFLVPVWSAITDWEPGEALTLWGWTAGVSSAAWSDNDGLAGATGATMFADIDGNGLVETAVTWAEVRVADLPKPIEMEVSGTGVLYFG